MADSANISGCQLESNAFPGTAIYEILLVYALITASPAAQAGMPRPATMNCSEVFVFLKKYTPIPTRISPYTIRMDVSMTPS